MKRGFKAGAERIATDIRLELGLRPTDRLEPIGLASHLEIPVFIMVELSSYCNGAADFCSYFSHSDPDSFSAVTIFLQKHCRDNRARNGATTAEIAAQYGASEALRSWPLAKTGIPQQLERTKRWYGITTRFSPINDWYGTYFYESEMALSSEWMQLCEKKYLTTPAL